MQLRLQIERQQFGPLRIDDANVLLRRVAAPDRTRCISVRIVVSASYDSTVRVWDAVGGTQLLCLRGHEGWDVRSVCFSPDGHRLASGSDDRTVRVWDAAGGAEGGWVTPFLDY